MQMKFFDESIGKLASEWFESPVDLGVVLGSGWAGALEADEELKRVSYAEIPGLGASTVVGHAGEMVLYRRHGKRIAAFFGRRHFYEGVEWEQVVFPIEALRRMGCKRVLLTNAAGGINGEFEAGDLVAISDHLDFIGGNPLIGENRREWGERFPDMSEVYSRKLRDKLRSSAADLGLKLREGVYAALSGPKYETPAEIRALKILGADLVGMSTAPEAVFARALGFEVAAISLVSNSAAGISPTPLSHEEVIEASEKAKPKLKSLIDDFINRL